MENNNQEGVQVAVVNEHPSFIESNTQAISYEDLKRDYVPSFGGDSELTIPHAHFIDVVRRSAEAIFGEICGQQSSLNVPTIKFHSQQKSTPKHVINFKNV